jgi:hypothetical protein
VLADGRFDPVEMRRSDVLPPTARGLFVKVSPRSDEARTMVRRLARLHRRDRLEMFTRRLELHTAIPLDMSEEDVTAVLRTMLAYAGVPLDANVPLVPAVQVDNLRHAIDIVRPAQRIYEGRDRAREERQDRKIGYMTIDSFTRTDLRDSTNPPTGPTTQFEFEVLPTAVDLVRRDPEPFARLTDSLTRCYDGEVCETPKYAQGR